jgi:hypothetical protein
MNADPIQMKASVKVSDVGLLLLNTLQAIQYMLSCMYQENPHF